MRSYIMWAFLHFFFSLFLLWFYSVHVVNDGKGGIFQQTIMAFIRDPADTIEQKTMNLAFVRNNNMKITHLHVKKKEAAIIIRRSSFNDIDIIKFGLIYA